MLKRKDGHVLRSALEIEVEGQARKEAKKNIEDVG